MSKTRPQIAVVDDENTVSIAFRLLPKLLVLALASGQALGVLASAQAADPLLSWNDGKAKQSIVEFVAKVTKPGSPDFVPVAERIATFDNDGTLWCEKPMPVQLHGFGV
jgi:hypothetical protein